MTNLIEILKKNILAKDPSLDLSGSSTLTDLLITPGSLMLEPFVKQLQFMLTTMSLRNPQYTEPSEIDAIMANFLKYRNKGSNSTGVVEMYYTSPINLDIPTGTSFSDTAGKTYITTKNHYVSSAQMSTNAWLYPYYSTGPISVESTITGVVTEIGPNQITTTNLLPAPASVTNPAGFSGGTDTESNLAFIIRAMTEVINGSLGSAQGIKNTLISSFPTIKDIQVKGMGDVEMLRDLVLSGVSTYPFPVVVDFYGKVSGLNELPYPGSMAYWSVFWDDPTTSGIQPDLPLLEQIAVDEWNTEQYGGIYNLDDAAYTKIKTNVIAEEHFSEASLAAHWRTSDARHGLGVVATVYEFTVEQRGGGNKLRLGYKVPTVDYGTRPITVNVQFMLNVINNLINATLLPAGTSSTFSHVNSLADVQVTEVVS